MTEKSTEPKGIIAIWTSPDGDVIATVADFNRSGYGGFKLWEAQKIRARDAVKAKAVRAYSSPHMTDCLDSYTFDTIAGRMLNKGHKISLRAVGYSDDIAAEVRRE